MTLADKSFSRYSDQVHRLSTTAQPQDLKAASVAINQTSSAAPAAPGPLAHSIRQQGRQSVSEDANRKAQQLADEWGSEISRYGLTSATLIREPPVVRNAPSRTPFASSPSKLRQSVTDSNPPPVRPVAALQSKRSSEENGLDPGARHSPPKRARLTAPSQISLSSIPQTPSPGTDQVVSPIFFSSSSRPMPIRPPSYPSTEGTSTMINRIHEGDERVTTHRLPKGNVSSAGTNRSSSTPGSWPFDSPGTDGRALSPSLQQLQGIGVIELLEQDERPTFIIDLANSANYRTGPIEVLFANAALRASQTVLDLVSSDTLDPENNTDFSRFKAWILSFVRNNESMDVCLPSLSYGGISWTCSTLRRRYRFVSGNSSAVSITPTSPSPPAQASSVLGQRNRGPTPSRDPTTPRERSSSETDYFGDTTARESVRRSHSVPRDVIDVDPETPIQQESNPDDDDDDDSSPSFDWTRIAISPSLPSHIQFARSIDWASTPLGPIENWAADLRSMSNLIMGSPHPAALYWGHDYTSIYNEAYIALAGRKHPRMMGNSYMDAWAEIWDAIEPIFGEAWNSGQATMKHDDRLFIIRNGFLEETYFSWSIVPVVGADGSVVALYNPAFENTRRKVNERRMLTLREIGEKTALSQTVNEFWGLVQQGLAYNPWDIPFALIYSVAEDSESESSSMHSGSLSNPPQIVLEGSLGVPENHHAAVDSIDLRTSGDGFAPYMRESMAQQGMPVVLSKEDGTLPSSLIEGLEFRGFGDPCRTVVVFPVHPTTTGDAVVGFIVVGVNPRRPYNEDYQLFINLLSRQLATSLASVVLFEEEIKRGQRAARLAALDRQELSLQLRLRTQEAVESEYKFTRMAEFVPVGMFIANEHGVINYCNDAWWEISRHPRSDFRSANTVETWMQSVRDEDRAGVAAVWQRLVTEKVAITHEFRFKNIREADGHAVDTWALMSAYPEKTEGGELRRIFGCLTDISQQKWAEVLQKQRMEEAVELKRQQENFIDITSHEMRNPLSAILQCADEITNTIVSHRSEDPSAYVPGKFNLLLESCLEASNTISLCASHQKRIVDDILTLSKLDSQLLLVTPVDVQPAVVIQNVLKMFETELNSNDIRGEFRIEKSYQDLDIDWVKLDPSRLRQILINLMTNAIKFTQSRERRAIVISLGATLDIEDSAESSRSYFPSRSPERENITDEPGWGSGHKIKLHVAVTDTGPGLDDHEKKMLFQRFSQTSPRTHVQYGGSGLGLFISRILTELQGGQIGVTSEKGLGSTFAFYIKSRMVPLTQLSPSIKPPASSPFKRADSGVAPVTYTAYATSGSKPPTPVAQDIVPRAVPDIAMTDPDASAPLDVLIVEDNLVNQKVLQRQLRKCGNNTHVANHGIEALEALRRSTFWSPEHAHQRPQLTTSSSNLSSVSGSSDTSHGRKSEPDNINISVVLMDLEMPVMDGMTCARKIRELEADGTIRGHVPIIAVTAYARPEQIENAKAAGIDDVISKPFRIPDLMPKIEELVAKYNTHTISTPA
ncbi:uncharacterized protein E0L32_011256 [Thyridium curvatum]|uniref:Uncharacterized protein n=1 Tax=Thyridium curvatum TaxID=1093900 RepID=A0A507B7E6_9PEZI|nr:uncharacterized protein E0L32_011256 [Thyridium curvatum]TPX19095.1 hypothetical protein E0L32_011256 [Thyridium curvatum]